MKNYACTLGLHSCETANVEMRKGAVEKEVVISISESGNTLFLNFTTPADAWRFGQRIAFEAEKMMLEGGK